MPKLVGKNTPSPKNNRRNSTPNRKAKKTKNESNTIKSPKSKLEEKMELDGVEKTFENENNKIITQKSEINIVPVEENTNFETVLKTLKSNQVSNEEKLEIVEEVWRIQINDSKSTKKKGYLLIDWLVSTCIASQRKKYSHGFHLLPRAWKFLYTSVTATLNRELSSVNTATQQNFRDEIKISATIMFALSEYISKCIESETTVLKENLQFIQSLYILLFEQKLLRGITVDILTSSVIILVERMISCLENNSSDKEPKMEDDNNDRINSTLAEFEKDWSHFFEYAINLLLKYYMQQTNHRKLFSLATEKLMVQFFSVIQLLKQQLPTSTLITHFQRVLAYCFYSGNTNDFSIAFKFSKKSEKKDSKSSSSSKSISSFQATLFEKIKELLSTPQHFDKMISEFVFLLEEFIIANNNELQVIQEREKENQLYRSNNNLVEASTQKQYSLGVDFFLELNSLLMPFFSSQDNKIVVAVIRINHELLETLKKYELISSLATEKLFNQFLESHCNKLMEKLIQCSDLRSPLRQYEFQFKPIILQTFGTILDINYSYVIASIDKYLQYICYFDDPKLNSSPKFLSSSYQFLSKTIALFAKIKQLEKFLSTLISTSIEVPRFAEPILKSNFILDTFSKALRSLPPGQLLLIWNLFTQQLQNSFLNVKKHFENNKTSFFLLTQLFQVFLETIEPTEANAKEVEQRCESISTEILTPLLHQYEKTAEREVLIGVLPLLVSLKSLSSHCQSLLIKTYSNEILEEGFPTPSPYFIDQPRLSALLMKYKPSVEAYQIRFVLLLTVFQKLEDIHIATSPINFLDQTHSILTKELQFLLDVIVKEFSHWKNIIIQQKGDRILSTFWNGSVTTVNNEENAAIAFIWLLMNNFFMLVNYLDEKQLALLLHFVFNSKVLKSSFLPMNSKANLGDEEDGVISIQGVVKSLLSHSEFYEQHNVRSIAMRTILSELVTSLQSFSKLKHLNYPLMKNLLQLLQKNERKEFKRKIEKFYSEIKLFYSQQFRFKSEEGIISQIQTIVLFITIINSFPISYFTRSQLLVCSYIMLLLERIVYLELLQLHTSNLNDDTKHLLNYFFIEVRKFYAVTAIGYDTGDQYVVINQTFKSHDLLSKFLFSHYPLFYFYSENKSYAKKLTQQIIHYSLRILLPPSSFLTISAEDNKYEANVENIITHSSQSLSEVISEFLSSISSSSFQSPKKKSKKNSTKDVKIEDVMIGQTDLTAWYTYECLCVLSRHLEEIFEECKLAESKHRQQLHTNQRQSDLLHLSIEDYTNADESILSNLASNEESQREITSVDFNENDKTKKKKHDKKMSNSSSDSDNEDDSNSDSSDDSSNSDSSDSSDEGSENDKKKKVSTTDDLLSSSDEEDDNFDPIADDDSSNSSSNSDSDSDSDTDSDSDDDSDDDKLENKISKNDDDDTIMNDDDEGENMNDNNNNNVAKKYEGKSEVKKLLPTSKKYKSAHQRHITNIEIPLYFVIPNSWIDLMEYLNLQLASTYSSYSSPLNSNRMEVDDDNEDAASNNIERMEKELECFGMTLQSYSQLLILFQISNSKYRSSKSKSFAAPTNSSQITFQSLLFLLKLLETTSTSSSPSSLQSESIKLVDSALYLYDRQRSMNEGHSSINDLLSSSSFESIIKQITNQSDDNNEMIINAKMNRLLLQTFQYLEALCSCIHLKPFKTIIDQKTIEIILMIIFHYLCKFYTLNINHSSSSSEDAATQFQDILLKTLGNLFRNCNVSVIAFVIQYLHEKLLSPIFPFSQIAVLCYSPLFIHTKRGENVQLLNKCIPSIVVNITKTLQLLNQNINYDTSISLSVVELLCYITRSTHVYPANNRIISISLECITAFTNCNQLTIQQMGNLKERYLLLSNLRDVQIFKCLCRLMCDQLKYRPKATTKAMPSYLFTLRSLLFSSVISLSAIADDNCYRFVARVFGELAKNYSLLRRYFPLIITDYIELMQRYSLNTTQRKEFQFGIFNLIDHCGDFDKKHIFSVCDNTGKEIFKELIFVHSRDHKFKGKT